MFDYIEKHNARTSIFYNFMFMPNVEQPVNMSPCHFSMNKHLRMVYIYHLGVKATVVVTKFKCMAVLFK